MLTNGVKHLGGSSERGKEPELGPSECNVVMLVVSQSPTYHSSGIRLSAVDEIQIISVALNGIAFAIHQPAA